MWVSHNAGGRGLLPSELQIRAGAQLTGSFWSTMGLVGPAGPWMNSS